MDALRGVLAGHGRYPTVKICGQCMRRIDVCQCRYKASYSNKRFRPMVEVDLPAERPHPAAADDPDHLDVGATDVKRKKPLQLDIRHDGKLYTLRLDAKDKLTVEVLGFHLESIDDLNRVRAMIAHVIRRAICRGIDKSEIVENELLARINMGDL